MKKIFAMTLALVSAVGLLTGCGSQSATTKASAADENSGVKTVKIAFCSGLFPMAYTAEDGTITGSDIEILRIVDENLPQFEFNFEEVSYDAGYTGVATGVYDIMLSDAYWTEERAQKYYLPENPLGANLVAMVSNKKYNISTLQEASELGLKPVPNQAGNGMWFVYKKYNDAHPDYTLDITADDGTAAKTAYADIANGRYDFVLCENNAYESQVVAEDGAYHEFADLLQGVVVTSVYTYPVIAKEETELAAAVDEQLGILYKDGTLQKKAEEFIGYDTFAYVESDSGDVN